MREILKTLFGEDSQKAIALHDKYMNLEKYKTDGSNYYETVRLNNRHTEFVGNPDGFSMWIKLYGEK